MSVTTYKTTRFQNAEARDGHFPTVRIQIFDSGTTILMRVDVIFRFRRRRVDSSVDGQKFGRIFFLKFRG